MQLEFKAKLNKSVFTFGVVNNSKWIILFCIP